MASYAVTFTWEQDWGSDFHGEDANTSCSWGQYDWYECKCAVSCCLFFLPVWDVDNVMQLWHLPATADPILVTGIYVSYAWKIALISIDSIPWTIDCTNLTQRIWNSSTLRWWITSWSYVITRDFKQFWWWLSNCSNHANSGGGSACDMNGNAEIMFDGRVVWQNFARVLWTSRMCTRHNNDRRSVLHLWNHEVRSIQNDPVRTSMSSPPSEISLLTEPGDKLILCSCF